MANLNEMKDTGIVRKIDELGRIVLPYDSRKRLDLKEGDSIHLFEDGQGIYLKKYEPVCRFCNVTTDLFKYNGLYICRDCAQKIGQLTEDTSVKTKTE